MRHGQEDWKFVAESLLGTPSTGIPLAKNWLEATNGRERHWDFALESSTDTSRISLVNSPLACE